MDNEAAETGESQSISLRDEILNAAQEVSEKVAETAPPEKPETSVEKPVEKSGPARDATGKFAKAEVGKVSLPADKPADTPAQPAAPAKTYTAPISWKAEAKAEFNNLPDWAKDEIIRRETEVHKGLTRQDEDRAFAKQVKEVITPYMPVIQAEGGNPVTAIRDLLNTAYVLRQANPQQKVALLQRVAQQYGVDLSQLSQPQQQASPEVTAMQAELTQLRQQMQAAQNYQQQQFQNTLVAEIEAFKADPNNAHFDAVKSHMAALLQAGVAKDLPEAYQMAVWANPETRATLEAARHAEAEAKRAEEAKQRTAAARNASVSVVGKPGAAVAANHSPNNSLRDELMANLRAAQGRV